MKTLTKIGTVEDTNINEVLYSLMKLQKEMNDEISALELLRDMAIESNAPKHAITLITKQIHHMLDSLETIVHSM
jgi:uncharacterized radical SAM superfamily protein